MQGMHFEIKTEREREEQAKRETNINKRKERNCTERKQAATNCRSRKGLLLILKVENDEKERENI